VPYGKFALGDFVALEEEKNGSYWPEIPVVTQFPEPVFCMAHFKQSS
jgi:hypothetical protein